MKQHLAHNRRIITILGLLSLQMASSMSMTSSDTAHHQVQQITKEALKALDARVCASENSHFKQENDTANLTYAPINTSHAQYLTYKASIENSCKTINLKTQAAVRPFLITQLVAAVGSLGTLGYLLYTRKTNTPNKSLLLAGCCAFLAKWWYNSHKNYLAACTALSYRADQLTIAYLGQDLKLNRACIQVTTPMQPLPQVTQ